MSEQWMPALGYEGRVEVSDDGQVRTVDAVRIGTRSGAEYRKFIPGQILSPHLNHSGYQVVQPKFGKDRKKVFVHRLVAHAFVPGFSEGMSVNHINGRKTDNQSSNLEWVTWSRNTELQWKDGLVNLRGENHPSHKLSAEQVLAARRALKCGAARSDVAILLNVSSNLVRLIELGERWAALCEAPDK